MNEIIDVSGELSNEELAARLQRLRARLGELERQAAEEAELGDRLVRLYTLLDELERRAEEEEQREAAEEEERRLAPAKLERLQRLLRDLDLHLGEEQPVRPPGLLPPTLLPVDRPVIADAERRAPEVTYPTVPALQPPPPVAVPASAPVSDIPAQPRQSHPWSIITSLVVLASVAALTILFTSVLHLPAGLTFSLPDLGGPTGPAADPVLRVGEAIYSRNCVSCHGERGDRLAAVDLGSESFRASRDDKTLFETIARGKGMMVAFGKASGGPLTDGDVKAVVAYLRSGMTRTGLLGGPATVEVQQGRSLYQQNCVSCHGAEGNRLPAAPLGAREFMAKLDDNALSKAIAEGKATMPAWGTARGGSLTEDQIDSVVAFLRYNSGTPSTKPPLSAQARMGRELFRTHCLSCHGTRGNRIPVSPLDSARFIAGLGDEGLTRAIVDGKGSMPGWGRARGGPLSPEQVLAVVAYLRYLSSPSAPAALDAAANSPIPTPAAAGAITAVPGAPAKAAPPAGQSLYAANCGVCHGAKGDQFPGAKLNDKAFLDARGDGGLLAAIRDGTGGMPGFKGRLSDEDIKAVIAFLRSL